MWCDGGDAGGGDVVGVSVSKCMNVYTGVK